MLKSVDRDRQGLIVIAAVVAIFSQISFRVGWAVKAPRDLGLAPRVPQLNQCSTECDKESEIQSMLPFLRTEKHTKTS